MLHTKSWLWKLAILLWSTSVVAVYANIETGSAPVTYNEQLARSVYKGTISGFKIEMVRTLTQIDEHRYVLKSEAKNLFASIKEVSEFQIKDNSLYPSQYTYERRLFGRSTTEKISFDWTAMSAFYTRSDRPQNDTTHAIKAGFLDPALYQLALQADLATQETDLVYEFVKRKRLEHYNFKALANESFSVQKHNYDSLVVLRENDEKDKITRLWVIPDLDYQVGQIRHTDDGDTYEIRLAEYQGNSAKLKQLYQIISRAPLTSASPTEATPGVDGQ